RPSLRINDRRTPIAKDGSLREELAMSATRQTRLALLVVLGVAAIGGAWFYVNRVPSRQGAASNAIMILAPYWYEGTWVFDDAAVGLKREPFVAGVPEMIDALVKDVPDAKRGFRLLFSANAFPGHQKKLNWLRTDNGGNYYRLDDPPLEGWICPALFKYYDAPPTALYVKAEPIAR
ncbi:MAG TPA: DUF6717 family protein, partial [Planctomycetia bacterium]|nr:DUF6717 family protein [Planctomycetia bacterium]